MFPASEDDRPNNHPVIIRKSPLDELLDERGTRVYDDVLSLFPFQAGDDSFEVSFHDPRVLPFGLFQEMRKDDLLTSA